MLVNVTELNKRDNNISVSAIGVCLYLQVIHDKYAGSSKDLLLHLLQETHVSHIVWNVTSMLQFII